MKLNNEMPNETEIWKTLRSKYMLRSQELICINLFTRMCIKNNIQYYFYNISASNIYPFSKLCVLLHIYNNIFLYITHIFLENCVAQVRTSYNRRLLNRRIFFSFPELHVDSLLLQESRPLNWQNSPGCFPSRRLVTNKGRSLSCNLDIVGRLERVFVCKWM